MIVFFYSEAQPDKAVEAEVSTSDRIGSSPADFAVEAADKPKALVGGEQVSKKSIEIDDGPSNGETHSMEIASVYDVVFDSDSSSPLSKIHGAFKREEKNESWANAMEEGIRLTIAKSEAKDWAHVESVECRATICEVAGFMLDTQDNQERDPRDLFPDDFEVGWWQGQGSISMPVRQHSYEEEGITRFLIIVADNDAIERALDAVR
jgi:hypothetical protein